MSKNIIYNIAQRKRTYTTSKIQNTGERKLGNYYDQYHQIILW